jgi:hypothetical protein
MTDNQFAAIKEMAEIIGVAVRAGVDAERGSIHELLGDLKFMLTDPDVGDDGGRIENALVRIRTYQATRQTA